MKKGKDEGKVMSPLFPRLHVNDAEKGGPRAPPRNKMALYEQLSVPKVPSRSTVILPLLPNNSGSLVPSAPSTQGSGHERNVVTPFCYTPTSAHSDENHHFHSSSGVNMSFELTNLEQKSGTFYHIPNVTGQLPLQANCSYSQPHSLSKLKNHRGEDDSEVPTFCQSGIIPDYYNAPQNMNKERATCLDLNSSVQLESACGKHQRNLNVSHSRESISATASSGLLTRDEIFEPSKRARTSLTKENKRNVVVDTNRLEDIHDSLHQGSMTLPENTDLPNPSKAVGGGYVSTSPKPSLLDGHRRSGGLEHELEEQKESESLQMGSIDRNCHVSNANMVGSMLGFDISPDDVVGIIGHKHFWKTRNAIVNQQRVFAVQVFELHRLIKVQRLIAGSPEGQLDNNLYLAEPASSTKKLPSESPTKKLPSESVQQLPSQIADPKNGSQKQDSNNEGAVKDAVGNPPFASPVDVDKIYAAQQTNQRPLENQPPVSMATDTQPTSWCFHPSQGNQWLVPVMSPSEGLIYKPYAGQCSPTPRLMSPFYGNYRPVNLTVMGGDFFNTTYGIPISLQQGIEIVPSNPFLGQTYFPPYGKPLVNPSTSGSAVEQMNLSVGDQSSRPNNHVSVGDINATVQSVHYQSLGNMPSQKSGGILGCFGKFQASKSSELQVSTASTPSKRAQADALPLFPVAPKIQESDQLDQIHGNEKQTRAIKVVPHKHKSASESAARIFRSIQEERNQYD
ncbi:protein EARLY FLOWERING 3 isoform X2 [Vitis vinifera]|uniref:protein EARLY FLOWERING 3 isoform X2 n=1 Tax=Vitis vinifera TaxID=29760 RepID=UPI0001983E64|nr:protein EARLY FLOWERING 3 isoform X2 [Vitis vinifera]